MNKWVGIGRLTKDADIRYSNKGNDQLCIARFTLAVDRRVVKKGGNEQTADFISCVAFGKQGEFVEKYLKQGSKIAVVGRIQTGSYKNDAGQTIYTTDIVTEEIEFAESKKDAESKPKASPEGFMQVDEDLENSLPFGMK